MTNSLQIIFTILVPALKAVACVRGSVFAALAQICDQFVGHLTAPVMPARYAKEPSVNGRHVAVIDFSEPPANRDSERRAINNSIALLLRTAVLLLFSKSQTVIDGRLTG